MMNKRFHNPTFYLLSSLCVLCVSVVRSSAADKDWATYRGNLQRTGNTDGLPGPTAGKVLWVHKSKDHFVASPVPAGKALLVSGLGFINTANFYALDLEPKAAKRILWSKSSPFIRQPTV